MDESEFTKTGFGDNLMIKEVHSDDPEQLVLGFCEGPVWVGEVMYSNESEQDGWIHSSLLASHPQRQLYARLLQASAQNLHQQRQREMPEIVPRVDEQ